MCLCLCVCVCTHRHTHARTHTRTHTSKDIYASRVDEARARGVAVRFSYGTQHAPRRHCGAAAPRAQRTLRTACTHRRAPGSVQRTTRSRRRAAHDRCGGCGGRRWEYSRHTGCSTAANVRRLSLRRGGGGGTAAARTEGTKPSPFCRNCRRSDMDMDMGIGMDIDIDMDIDIKIHINIHIKIQISI
jgi:hypothetical protein